MVQWTIELVINDDFIALDKPEEQKEFCQIISKIENQELVKIDKNNEIYFQEYLFQIQSSIPKAVSKQDLLDIYEKLNNFLELYQNESDRIIAYFFGVLIWISYALSIDAENDFDRYMDFVVKNNFHIGGFLENFVTIKNIKQEDYIDPKYFYILIGLHIKPCLTTLGQKNVNQILPEFYKLLDLDYKKSKINYLYRLYVFQTEKTPLISRGESTQYVKSIVIKTIHLTNSPTNDFAKECVKNLAREAENIWREKNDIPKINEGWSSEMALFREIHSALESFDVDVKHHVRLSFLGQQHYDIYIPKHKIAIEYQGDQHFRPVDFFGGEKVFKQNQERDLRKKQLSKKNDIKLIEVLPDYHINSLIKTVLEIIFKDDTDLSSKLDMAIKNINKNKSTINSETENEDIKYDSLKKHFKDAKNTEQALSKEKEDIISAYEIFMQGVKPSVNYKLDYVTNENIYVSDTQFKKFNQKFFNAAQEKLKNCSEDWKDEAREQYNETARLSQLLYLREQAKKVSRDDPEKGNAMFLKLVNDGDIWWSRHQIARNYYKMKQHNEALGLLVQILVDQKAIYEDPKNPNYYHRLIDKNYKFFKKVLDKSMASTTDT